MRRSASVGDKPCHLDGRPKDDVAEHGVDDEGHDQHKGEVQQIVQRLRNCAGEDAHSRLEVEQLEDPEQEQHDVDATQ